MTNILPSYFTKTAASRAPATNDKNTGSLPAPVTSKKAKKNAGISSYIPGPRKLLIGGLALTAAALASTQKGRSAFKSAKANLPGLPEVPSVDLGAFLASVAPTTSFSAKHVLAKRDTEWFTETVQGSTLASLGAYFGFSEGEMEAANPGAPLGVLAAGQKIALPGEPRLHDPNQNQNQPTPTQPPAPSPTGNGGSVGQGLSLTGYSLPAGPLTSANGISAGNPNVSQDTLNWLADASQEPAIGQGEGFHYGAPKSLNVFPEGSPQTEDINQTEIGDCFLDAVLASAANGHADALKGIITQTGSNSFNVQLFDPNGKPVTIGVSGNMLYDNNGYQVSVSGQGDIADWGSIVEKAFAKYNDAYAGITGTGISWGNIANGGWSAWAMKALTGHNSAQSFNFAGLDSNALGAQLSGILANGGLIGMGTEQEGSYGSATIVGGHEYSVLAVKQDSTANGGWAVTLRNPWGTTPQTNGGSDSSTNGKITMGIRDAQNLYQILDYSA